MEYWNNIGRMLITNHNQTGPSSDNAPVKLDQLVEQPHQEHQHQRLNGGATDVEDEEMPVEKLQPQINLKEEKEHLATEEEAAGEAMDVASVASAMGLAVVSVDGWMVVQRASFDLSLESEPYHAMQLMVNPASRDYLVRIWGKTRSRGKVRSRNCNHFGCSGLQ